MRSYKAGFLLIGLALIVGFAIAGLIIGPSDPGKRDVGLSTPVITYSPPVVKMEDDPTWDCYEDGNRICGDVDNVYSTEAWGEWDSQNGGRFLRIDPSREYRVDYIGTSISPPRLRCNEIGLPSLHYWYIFRATYMDGDPACD